MDNVDTKPQQLPIRDLDYIQDLCTRITSAIIDGKPGVDAEDLAWLEKTKRDYKLALAVRRQKPLSKEKLKYIEENGIRNTRPLDAEIGIELVEALYSTSIMINKTNPVAAREGIFQGDEYVDVCTQASREFTDFFIKVHKKQNLGDDELINLFETIFIGVGLNEELKTKALDKFPGGVIAAVRSYLEIHRQLPDWVIEVATHYEDKHCGIDLTASSPDKTEKRYYGIKGNKDFTGVSITEVTSQSQMETVRNKLMLRPSLGTETGGHESSLYRIYEYTREVNSKGENTRAFWVEAPSTF